MCISKVMKRFAPPLAKEVVRWKVFQMDSSGRLYPEIMRRDGTPHYEEDCWYRAHGGALDVNNEGEVYYLAGFHGFMRREDAVDWLRMAPPTSSPLVLRCVRMRDVYIEGLQDVDYGVYQAPVSVADYMKIIPEPTAEVK